MGEHADRPAIRFPPPLVFLGFVLLGPVIDQVAGWPNLPGGTLRSVTGGLLLFAGLILVFTAVGLFRRADEDPQPWTGTATLVTGGLYRFTRNPMYLGMAVAHAGLALLLGSYGALVGLPFAMVAIDRFVITAEEVYLKQRLGLAYADYCANVRRWL
jgi:protein-S-isoprenylcysteine O-methyltransferase Ste14